jgi:hypothetical protein
MFSLPKTRRTDELDHAEMAGLGLGVKFCKEIVVNMRKLHPSAEFVLRRTRLLYSG